MENILRVLITIFVIGMVVMVIVFFSIFGIVPAEKLTEALKGDSATSTSNGGKTIVVEKIIKESSNNNSEEESEPEEKQTSPEEKENGEKEKEPTPITTKATYTVNLSGGRFSPSSFNAEKGEEVKIRLVSEDKTYRVMIPAYGLSQTVSPGDNKLIAFQAVSAGQFRVVCDGCVEDFEGTLMISQ